MTSEFAPGNFGYSVLSVHLINGRTRRTHRSIRCFPIMNPLLLHAAHAFVDAGQLFKCLFFVALFYLPEQKPEETRSPENDIDCVVVAVVSFAMLCFGAAFMQVLLNHYTPKSVAQPTRALARAGEFAQFGEFSV